MDQATPQRTVTVSLIGMLTETVRISYSYWSPHDGLSRIGSPTCDLYQQCATNTLFTLDYFSTINGWTITGTEPNDDTPPLPAILGPEAVSIMTQFPDTSPGEYYSFYILYLNTVTGARVRFDPQEGNKPPPSSIPQPGHHRHHSSYERR
jgi:hypothetical protein